MSNSDDHGPCDDEDDFYQSSVLLKNKANTGNKKVVNSIHDLDDHDPDNEEVEESF